MIECEINVKYNSINVEDIGILTRFICFNPYYLDIHFISMSYN